MHYNNIDGTSLIYCKEYSWYMCAVTAKTSRTATLNAAIQCNNFLLRLIIYLYYVDLRTASDIYSRTAERKTFHRVSEVELSSPVPLFATLMTPANAAGRSASDLL